MDSEFDPVDRGYQALLDYGFSAGQIADAVNAPDFDMSSDSNCVLGKLFGSYVRGALRVLDAAVDSSFEFGFQVFPGGCHSYSGLSEGWRRKVAASRRWRYRDAGLSQVSRSGDETELRSWLKLHGLTALAADDMPIDDVIFQVVQVNGGEVVITERTQP